MGRLLTSPVGWTLNALSVALRRREPYSDRVKPGLHHVWSCPEQANTMSDAYGVALLAKATLYRVRWIVNGVALVLKLHCIAKLDVTGITVSS
jgi:hypothetical protein